MDLLREVFAGLDRLAPGSEASTLRALEAVRRVREPGRILDAGCGTGASALTLLRHTRAAIAAVDVDAASLNTLQQRAVAAGVADRLTTRAASIDALDFAPGSFDAIWCEGAIYTIGFDLGLRTWRPLLVPGGIVACTELTWLTGAPSDRARAFWAAGYPAMRGTDANVAGARAAGYRCLDHFALPATDWTVEYYGPLARRLEEMRARYRADGAALAALDGIAEEIELYRACGRDYGYVFYILQ